MSEQLDKQILALREKFLQETSPEFKVILDLFDMQRTEVIQRPANFSFEKFLQLIARHRIHPTLSMYLDKLKTVLTENEITTLKAKIQPHILKQMQLTGVLFQVLALFKKENIDAISIKGPILSYQLYKNFSARESIDLDILILPENLKKVDAILKAQGFECEHELDRFEGYSLKVFYKIVTDLQYIRKSDQVKIEIHWKLFEIEDTFYLSTAEIFKNTKTLQIAGQTILILNDEVLINYLIIHGAKHIWFRLKWLLDIVKVINGDFNIQWKKVQTFAYENKNELAFDTSIAFTNLLYPNQSINQLSPFIAIVPHIIQTFFDAVNNASLIDTPEIRTFTFTKLKQGKKFKIKVFKHLIFSPIDWQLIKLPASLFLLYIPLRPFLYLYRKSTGHI